MRASHLATSDMPNISSTQEACFGARERVLAADLVAPSTIVGNLFVIKSMVAERLMHDRTSSMVVRRAVREICQQLMRRRDKSLAIVIH